MSRGFVKEDDQEEIPMVPPRADLPAGVTNYVTPAGLESLISERNQLQFEKDNLVAINENERRIAVNFIQSKLELLTERIGTAKVVALNKQPLDEIRFGALVTVEVNDEKKPQEYQIVGVDEANIKERKIAFISPIAQLLINKKIGDQVALQLGTRTRIFTVKAIRYAI